jgi:hypothetical protein
VIGTDDQLCINQGQVQAFRPENSVSYQTKEELISLVVFKVNLEKGALPLSTEESKRALP